MSDNQDFSITNLETIEHLLREIDHLKRGVALLNNVYSILGPYAFLEQDKKGVHINNLQNYQFINFEEFMRNLKDYYYFDDNE